MKKLLLFVSALILAAACAAPPTNQSMPANTNSAASTSTGTLSEADAIAKEKATWTALQNKDMAAFAGMLASDFVEVGDDGTYEKAADIEHLKDLTISSTDFSNWKVIPIDKDATLLTYNVTVKGSFKGNEIPPDPSRAASVWVNRDGKWQAIYYQETRAKTAPPPAPAPATTPAKSASPSATTADTTAMADPVAREKAAWDALKRKDYDTFASFLDEAQMEVEAEGVSDKAGTLRGVRMFDASKSQLSDFKTVNFDSDAALVTYVVKSSDPKAPVERHSTIWVKRDGKWLAFFHQGTPAMPASATAAPGAASSPAHMSASPAMKPPAKKM